MGQYWLVIGSYYSSYRAYMHALGSYYNGFNGLFCIILGSYWLHWVVLTSNGFTPVHCCGRPTGGSIDQSRFHAIWVTYIWVLSCLMLGSCYGYRYWQVMGSHSIVETWGMSNSRAKNQRTTRLRSVLRIVTLNSAPPPPQVAGHGPRPSTTGAPSPHLTQTYKINWHV